MLCKNILELLISIKCSRGQLIDLAKTASIATKGSWHVSGKVWRTYAPTNDRVESCAAWAGNQDRIQQWIGWLNTCMCKVGFAFHLVNIDAKGFHCAGSSRLRLWNRCQTFLLLLVTRGPRDCAVKQPSLSS
jgi:hypothetical protein